MTAADFLRAIIEDPDVVGPRLVFADWLDERGDPRGEFIRVQVELASDPTREKVCRESCQPPDFEGCPQRALRRRERELWVELRPFYYEQFLPGQDRTLSIDEPDRNVVVPFGVVRRGFVESVALPLDAFMGGACWRCVATGYVAGEKVWSGDKCPACAGSGKLAAALALACPLREVRLTDREPSSCQHSPAQRQQWRFWSSDHQRSLEEPDVLPTGLFGTVYKCPLLEWSKTGSYACPDLDRLKAALSWGCVRHARTLAFPAAVREGVE